MDAASSPPLEKDLAFEILSSSRRRAILYLLRSTDEAIAVTALAETVASWENDTHVDDISPAERKRVYVSMHQTHIPKLADAGLVTHVEESVAATDRIQAIDAYLLSESSQLPWPKLAAASIAVVGCLVTITGLVGSVPVAVGYFAAALLVTLFGGFGLGQFLEAVRSADTIPRELRCSPVATQVANE